MNETVWVGFTLPSICKFYYKDFTRTSISEMFNNLDRNYWVYFYQLPCWFEEGLALQFNNNGVYSSKSLESVKKLQLEDLRKIEKYREFYVSDHKQLLNHYQVAKLEIERWLNENSKEDILKVIKAFKNGLDFYEAYSNPKLLN